jgi:hypothetical protein
MQGGPFKPAVGLSGVHLAAITSAVRYDVVPQASIDLGRLSHSAFQQLHPLFRGFVVRHRTEQIIGLDYDFQGIAQIVRKASNFLRLIGRNVGWIGHAALW